MRTSILVAGVFLLACLTRTHDARACGGCFSPPVTQNPTVVTDHRMILSVSQQQTTLYDQIKYSGAPDSFAWVLPIAGVADVGLSADIVFGTLDALTHTTIVQPPTGCPPPPNCGNSFGAAADASAAPNDGVQVLKQEVVGPYETVQLASTNPTALADWLTGHGYDIPTDVQPVIDAYVAEGFDFLAMKLVPGASVQSMRPVRVTTPGASPSLPLRMVAAGTGQSVGITLWIIGEGRYEPQNFPSFRIQDSEIVWDFATQSSNYAQLRQIYEQQNQNRAWEMESSIGLYPPQFTQIVDYGGYVYPYYNYDAGTDYQPTTTADGGTESPSQVRDADLATLFAGMNPADVRVTRIRTDMARAGLATDLVVQASSDQALLPNTRYPTKSINKPQCPTYPPCQNGQNGSDAGGISVYGGTGCGVSPESNSSVAFAFGGLFIVVVRAVARRRKR
jgi:hypothetical protein